MLSKIAITTAVVSAGKCPFGFDTPSNDSLPHAHPRVRSTAAYPSEIFTCPGNTSGLGIPTTTSSFDKALYKLIVAEVITQYEAVSATVSDNTNLRAKYAGCLVRTAGHDFMDYRNTNGVLSGGSDGCINFGDGDNTGLADCLEASGLIGVFQNYCTTTSLADFLIIAAEAVMGRTAQKYDASDYYAKGTAAEAFMENF